MSQTLDIITLCVQLVPVFMMMGLILRLSTLTKVKQIYQQNIAVHLQPLSMKTLQSYSYLPWSLLLPFTKVYKALIKYQYLLKQCVNSIQNTFHAYQLNFTIHQKNDRDQTPETQVRDTKMTGVTTHHTQKPQRTPKNAPHNASVISGKKVITNSKNEQQNQHKQKSTLNRTKSAEWTVVVENKKKKKRHSSSVQQKATPTKEKRRSSAPTLPSTKKSHVDDKRLGVNKSNPTSPKIDNSKSKTTTLISPSLPWSDIVKNQESESESLSHDDVPLLSDNDSLTGSIESPCMSHKDLFHHSTAAVGSGMVEKKSRYYSPFFSTAFDFGVLPLQQSQPQQQQVFNDEMLGYSTIDNRLDEYLNSQQPYWNGNKQYTPTTMTQHKKSILNLLNQSDQVETSITPTSFKYFDDMMMSTSLYKTDETVNKYSLLMNSNKRDWDSISHYIH